MVHTYVLYVACFPYLSEVLLQETQHAPCLTVTMPWISMECEMLQASFVAKCLQSGCIKLCQVIVI